MLEDPDRRTGGVGDVVARAADVEHRARLDPKELLGLRFVGEEADVLLDRHPLLADVGDRPSGRGLADRERRHPVEVDHRADELVDQETIVVEPFFHLGRW